MVCISDLPTELLHQILLHLPTIDLLLAQRVCRQWQNDVNKSLALQQALYLSPREPEVYWKYTFHADPQCMPTEAEPGSTLSLDFHSSCADPPFPWNRTQEIFTKARVGMEPFTQTQMTAAMYGDPVIDNRDFMQRRSILGEHNPLFLSLDSSFSIWSIMKETGSSFLRFHERCAKRSNCRAMFLTQPPARRLTYTWKFDRSSQDYLWSSGEITNNSGITMADVMDEVEGLEKALQREISWIGSYIVIDGPLCPSTEQEREYERDMDTEYVQYCKLSEL